MFKVRQDKASEREVGRLLQRRVKFLGGHAAALKINERAFGRAAISFPVIESLGDKKIRYGAKARFRKRVARARGFGIGFGFAFVTCRDIVLQFSTVTRCHVSTRTYARSVHTDDIMHYVRTLNIYELFNDAAGID